MSKFTYEEYDEKEANNNTMNGGITSGVHEVTIIGLYPKKTGKIVVFDMEVQLASGARGFVFGLNMGKKTKNGKDNYMLARTMELRKAVGAKKKLTEVKAKRKMNGKETEVIGIKEFKGKKAQLALQVVYSEYEGKVSNTLALVKSWNEKEDVGDFEVKDYDPDNLKGKGDKKDKKGKKGKKDKKDKKSKSWKK